jgi:rod shape-determining protein MreD
MTRRSMGKRRGGANLWLAAATLILALYLTILHLPAWPLDQRPPWVALTLLFWCFAAPERIGVLVAFVMGLALDALTGSLLGQHALALSAMTFLVVVLRARIRIFPLWQQTFFVWLILLVERLLTLWVMGSTGQPMPPLSYWVPSLAGLVLWPFLSRLLTPIERRVRAD